jgi:group II intron reverse transcriptase/maturase
MISKTDDSRPVALRAAKPGAALLDRILMPTNLAAAWEAVAANEGMPGVDRVAIGRFARTWEERTAALAEEVRAGRYRPSPLRVRFIPKRDGGQRRISIPTVADRVLQRAALEILLPHFDRKFLSCSYGYRPKRGVAQAVAAVIRYRDRGLRYVLEADIDDCFGSFDHELLLRLLEQEVSDWRVMQLMRWWLDVGRPIKNTARGIALGMPISPLWANIYLHELDWRLVRNRWPLVRYADDFVVLTDSTGAAERAHAVAATALADLKLRLEPAKTRISSFGDGFEFLGVRFQGDEYSFLWQEKRITVAGAFDWLWGQHIAYEY